MGNERGYCGFGICNVVTDPPVPQGSGKSRSSVHGLRHYTADNIFREKPSMWWGAFDANIVLTQPIISVKLLSRFSGISGRGSAMTAVSHYMKLTLKRGLLPERVTRFYSTTYVPATMMSGGWGMRTSQKHCTTTCVRFDEACLQDSSHSERYYCTACEP